MLAAAMQPYQLVQRDWRQELPHLLAVFLVVLLLYGYTAPRLVTLEDDGLFIANLHHFGVAHPPGYPLHTFLGGIFYQLLLGLDEIWQVVSAQPLSSPAFKGHFFSGFAGAVACSAIYAIVAMLVRGRVFAYLGGLAYGFSDTFWSQAIIAEVYTLNSMLFFIVMALCLRYAGQAGRSGIRHRQLFMVLTFVYGLGVANHYPLLGLGSIGLGLMVLSQISNILPRAVMGVGCLLAGAVPFYVWMVWRSGYNVAANPANFYGPIGLLGLNEKEKVVDFSFYFLRSGYTGVDKQADVGLEDKLVFAQSLADDMLWQFTPLGFVFVVWGFVAMARSRFSWLWLSLLVSWFMSSVLLLYLLDFRAEYIWLAAFRVYPITAYGIMSIWLAVGAAAAADKLRFMPFVQKQAKMVVLVMVIGLSAIAHWEKNNRRDYKWAHDLAVARLDTVEENAILFTFDDLDVPMGYLHFVEGRRPDLKIYNDQGLVYGDRPYSPLTPDHGVPGSSAQTGKSDILRSIIEQSSRPVYYHAARLDLFRHPHYGSDFLGFFRRVNRSGPEERIILPDHLRLWLDKNADARGKITDLWTRQQHAIIVSQLINGIELASYNGLNLSEEWQEVIQRALSSNPMARLYSNTQRLQIGHMDEPIMRRELAWMKEFNPVDEPLLGRQLRSLFYWEKAVLSSRTGDDSVDYEATLLQGLAADSATSNPVVSELLNFYKRQQRFCDFVKLIGKVYPQAADIPQRLLPELRQARISGNCV